MTLGKNLTFTEQAMQQLLLYSWPGNVKELENIIERVAILSDSPFIDIDLLPPEIKNGKKDNESIKNIGIDFFNVGKVEKMLINQALIREKGNKTKAAELLGFSLRTLHNKLGKVQAPSEIPCN